MKGLRNAGNTCWFNAALQCLLYAPNLANYFIDGQEGAHTVPRRKLAASFAARFGELVREYWTTGQVGDVMDAQPVLDAFRKACRGFAPNAPHDAHEAVLLVLDKLHSALARLPAAECAVARQPGVSGSAWAKSLKGESSAVSELFRGQLELRITPAQGDAQVTHDHFTVLSVSLSECGALTTALQRHMAPETVPDYAPSGATLSKRFTYLPSVLVLHFKRFDGANGKIDRFVDYPSDLDMSPFAASGEWHYQLFAAVLHRGTADDGHYTACAEVHGRWFAMDDAHASPMSNVNDVVQRDAYVLMYRRLE